jgi:hypothetical protein
MMKYFLAAVLIASCAFAVSNDCIVGEGAPIDVGYNPVDTRDDELWSQWGQGANVACGSMWYEGMGQDMAVADNYLCTSAGYNFTDWETYFCYWYGSPSASKGAWVCIYEDGGSAPATTEPYEYGSNPGWHADMEAGNGGEGYADITGLKGGDYWEYGDTTETLEWYLFGFYPVYRLSANFGDTASGGWIHISDDTNEEYWATQRYAPSQPYGGPPDVTDTLSPNWFQRGVSGASWSYPGYPYGMPLTIYGEPGDETDPVITDMYPTDEDYPSGVPVDSWAGCHWTDMEEGDVGIRVADSWFNLYDSNMDVVTGSLMIDDADIYDVIVDFEPDDVYGEGATYTVETECFDLAGNSDFQTWDFTTGFVNIEERSFGSIKADFR